MISLSPTKHPRLNEFVGLAAWTIASLLLLSLISYHPGDPSLNLFQTEPAAQAAPHNIIGRAGSYSADFLLQGFGLSFFLVPIFLFVYGYRWFRSAPIETPWVKLIGLAVLIFSLSSLLATFPHSDFLQWRLKSNIGGLLGLLLVEQLQALFNPAGSIILLVALVLFSLYITTSFSLRRVMEWLGAHSRAFTERYRAFIQQREERKREKTKLKMERGEGTRQNAIIVNEAVEQAETEQAPAGFFARTFRRKAKQAEREEESLIAETPNASSARARTTATRSVRRRPETTPSRFRLPLADLLNPSVRAADVDEEELTARARQLEAKCREFDVNGTVTQIHPGPVVTTYEFKPEAGIKYSRITNLEDDLCLALRAESVLIDRIPGKSTVGIEVPNLHRQTIFIREVIESQEFQETPSRLALGLGKDATGNIVVEDLTRMPHLLIAGSTGAGKSVAINAMLFSILYKSTPEEVKLVLVDPKRLELGLYKDIPHLLTPVVDDPKKASNALAWATREMESRYRRLAQHAVRNIEQYNQMVRSLTSPKLADDTSENSYAPLPYLVIVIDELADLMIVASKDVEESITRLAQMARAVGIHLILATQRPSVDVITGLIKANFPSRISFRVASKIDSRTILDCNGAEQLLGKGDMLYLPPGSSRLTRVHGALVTEEEIHRLTEFLRAQARPTYNEQVLEDVKEKEMMEDLSDEKDELYDEAVRLVVEMGKASTSTLQRRLRLGYSRAARLIDLMERDGIVGPADGSKPREVLVKKDYFREFDERYR